MAARRDNPAERQREREELRRAIEEPQEEISLGMMPLAPGDLRGIFMGLKALAKRLPREQAEDLIGRVGKMLRATPEEMEGSRPEDARPERLEAEPQAARRPIPRPQAGRIGRRARRPGLKGRSAGGCWSHAASITAGRNR